jgi:hypothetical protein
MFPAPGEWFGIWDGWSLPVGGESKSSTDIEASICETSVHLAG